MPGLIAYSIGGLGFLLVSAIESIPLPVPLPAPLPPPRRLRFFAVAVLAFLSLISSTVSLFAPSPQSPFSAPLSLTTIAVSLLFLLYALSPLLLPFPLPSPLLDLICLFAFLCEFLLFFLRSKDPDGVENRYFDLLLAPILVVLVSTVLAIAKPRSLHPRVARSAGLALHGTWLIQMGFSFFSSAIPYGCALHHRSRADYTIKCKTHEDYHRGRAIATLLFNCHLALLVAVGAGIYAAAVRSKGGEPGYRPLSKEMHPRSPTSSRFTLDSDEETETAVADGEVTVHEIEANAPQDDIPNDHHHP